MSRAINPLASAHELVHYLHVSEPCALFIDSDMIPKFMEAKRLDQAGKLAGIRLVSLDENSSGQQSVLRVNDLIQQFLLGRRICIDDDG